MRVLALNGSPEKDGNISFLIDEVLEICKERGAEVEKVDILEVMNKGKWFPCINCSNPCNSACFKGTVIEETFEKMREADFIILGSPVYFGTVSGILKCFWDKTRVLRSEKALLGKKCAVITSGFAPFGGQEKTISALHDMALVQGMEIVADGAAGFDAGHHGVASSGDARQDKFAIERCKVLAERIMQRTTNNEQ